MTDRASPVATRWSAAADEAGLARVHRDAWRYAYAGIIPGLTLERMIARRGPAWWGRMHDRGFRALVLDCDGTLAGYATFGTAARQAEPGRARSTSSTSAPSTRAAASAAASSPSRGVRWSRTASAASPSGP